MNSVGYNPGYSKFVDVQTNRPQGAQYQYSNTNHSHGIFTENTVPQQMFEPKSNRGFFGTLFASAGSFIKGGTVNFLANTAKAMFCDENGKFSLWATAKTVAITAGVIALGVATGGTAWIALGLGAVGVAAATMKAVPAAVEWGQNMSNGEYDAALKNAEDVGEGVAIGVTSAVPFIGGAKAAMTARAAALTKAGETAKAAELTAAAQKMSVLKPGSYWNATKETVRPSNYKAVASGIKETVVDGYAAKSKTLYDPKLAEVKASPKFADLKDTRQLLQGGRATIEAELSSLPAVGARTAEQEARATKLTNLLTEIGKVDNVGPGGAPNALSRDAAQALRRDASSQMASALKDAKPGTTEVAKAMATDVKANLKSRSGEFAQAMKPMSKSGTGELGRSAMVPVRLSNAGVIGSSESADASHGGGHGYPSSPASPGGQQEPQYWA